MKEAMKNFKENVIGWLSSPYAATAVTVGVLMVIAWVAGWLMGHAGGGVTMSSPIRFGVSILQLPTHCVKLSEEVTIAPHL